MNEAEYDWDEIKEEAREEYQKKTGETLPDHVLENLQVLQAAGPTVEDLNEAVYLGREMSTRDVTKGQAVALALVSAGVAGAVSFGAGVALASSFATAVVALVSAAFGFAVAALMAGG